MVHPSTRPTIARLGIVGRRSLRFYAGCGFRRYTFDHHRRVAHPSTPPKQKPLNFRVPHSRRRRGCGFRRDLTTVVPRNSYFASRSGVPTLCSPHRRRNLSPISVAPQSRTLACPPQAVENAAPGTANATATPKPINFYVNYRSGIILRPHASIATARIREYVAARKSGPPAILKPAGGGTCVSGSVSFPKGGQLSFNKGDTFKQITPELQQKIKENYQNLTSPAFTKGAVLQP